MTHRQSQAPQRVTRRTDLTRNLRQVDHLRRGDSELQTRIEDLSTVARENRELVDKIHRLTLELLALDGAAERMERLRLGHRRDFSVDRAALVVFSPVRGFDGDRRFVQVMHRRDPRLKAFAGWLDRSRPRCGPVLHRHRAFVFGEGGSAR